MDKCRWGTKRSKTMSKETTIVDNSSPAHIPKKHGPNSFAATMNTDITRCLANEHCPDGSFCNTDSSSWICQECGSVTNCATAGFHQDATTAACNQRCGAEGEAQVAETAVKVCYRDHCRGLPTNPIPSGETWTLVGQWSSSGCCRNRNGACILCTPPKTDKSAESRVGKDASYKGHPVEEIDREKSVGSATTWYTRNNGCATYSDECVGSWKNTLGGHCEITMQQDATVTLLDQSTFTSNGAILLFQDGKLRVSSPDEMPLRVSKGEVIKGDGPFNQWTGNYGFWIMCFTPSDPVPTEGCRWEQWCDAGEYKPIPSLDSDSDGCTLHHCGILGVTSCYYCCPESDRDSAESQTEALSFESYGSNGLITSSNMMNAFALIGLIAIIWKTYSLLSKSKPQYAAVDFAETREV